MSAIETLLASWECDPEPSEYHYHVRYCPGCANAKAVRAALAEDAAHETPQTP